MRKNSKNNFRSSKKVGKISKNNYQDRFADAERAKGMQEEKGVIRDKIWRDKDTIRMSNNDPQWYFKDANILKDVASFSFSTALGAPLDLSAVCAPFDNGTTTSEVGVTAASVPGLMSFEMGPSVGLSEDASSPINIAATNVYSFVRYKNSGASNYDAPDLMLYLIAMDSLYAAWNWMKRLYGCISTYSSLNRYQPVAYIAANHVDFADLSSNLANFRAFLNMKAAEISAFNVPATMTYNVRHSWLFSNIYKDSETSKSQEYMFVPSYFYKYDETSSSEGGILDTINISVGLDPMDSSKLLKVEDLKNILNTMLNALQYSEDIGIMSGDILKAYGSNLFRLSTIDADYNVRAVYNREVLSQIENLSVANVVENATYSDLSSFKIRHDPNTNFIKCAPVGHGQGSDYDGTILNMHTEFPTPEEVMVATRLYSSWERQADYSTEMTSSGSEIVTGSYIFVNMPNYTSLSDYLSDSSRLYTLHAFVMQPQYTMTLLMTQEQMLEEIVRWAYLNQFDWAPLRIVGYAQKVDTKTKITVLSVIGDLDNYTILDQRALRAMNQLALLSEFNVPS